MKNRHFTLLLLSVLQIFSSIQIFSQCEPDTEGCIDVDEPGQMCPRILPDAIVNEPYEVVLTVIPPKSFEFVPGTSINIEYITVDTVWNIPVGMSYEANADIFYADTAYCILISGTPLEAGTDTLSIAVTAYVNTNGSIIPTPQVVDSSTIVVSVLEPSGIDPGMANQFHLLPNIPNPFSQVTRIGFFSPYSERIEFSVYNILGELLHQESHGFPPGENYFDFQGEKLPPGSYIYRVTNSKEVYTGKFIKARM